MVTRLQVTRAGTIKHKLHPGCCVLSLVCVYLAVSAASPINLRGAGVGAGRE